MRFVKVVFTKVHKKVAMRELCRFRIVFGLIPDLLSDGLFIFLIFHFGVVYGFQHAQSPK